MSTYLRMLNSHLMLIHKVKNRMFFRLQRKVRELWSFRIIRISKKILKVMIRTKRALKLRYLQIFHSQINQMLSSLMLNKTIEVQSLLRLYQGIWLIKERFPYLCKRHRTCKKRKLNRSKRN